MKTNGILLVIEAMLAFIVTAGVLMGDMFSFEGLMCWTLTFCIWFLMFLPAWEMPEKKNKYEEMLKMRDEDTNNYAQSKNEEGARL